MTGERYVLLGLGRPGAAWFASVARWATSAALPAEFVKCVSPEEVRARLRSGKAFSAALLDGSLPSVDRDLLAAVAEAGCAALVVADARTHRSWDALGAAGTLPGELTREALLESLARHAAMIGAPEGATAAADLAPAVAAPWEGRVAAVCGPGGTGASTVAVALAQGLAQDDRTAGLVLLADLCLRAEQAMLHDAGEVFPGLQELVEAHRSALLPPEEVRTLAHRVHERGYDLLLGLRRARYWAVLRPRAFEAAFTALRRGYQVLVCDVDADFETEEDAGSADVAERCMLARVPVEQADVVFAVGVGGMKGLHSLARVVSDLVHVGVPAERVQPVLNVAPRHPAERAELATCLAELRPRGCDGMAAPLFLPRRKVGQALRDGVRMPNPLPQLLTGAWYAALARAGAATPAPAEPQRVRPGSLGSWSVGPGEVPGEAAGA